MPSKKFQMKPNQKRRSSRLKENADKVDPGNRKREDNKTGVEDDVEVTENQLVSTSAAKRHKSDKATSEQKAEQKVTDAQQEGEKSKQEAEKAQQKVEKTEQKVTTDAQQEKDAEQEVEKAKQEVKDAELKDNETLLDIAILNWKTASYNYQSASDNYRSASTVLTSARTKLMNVESTSHRRTHSVNNPGESTSSKKAKFGISDEEWTTAEDSCPEILASSSHFIRIPKHYLDGSGLVTACEGNSTELLLFRRDDVNQQFDFLQNNVIDGSSIAYILGPPGTGKSVTSFAFAMSLSRKKWVVTWVHIRQSSYPLVERFSGETKTCTSFQSGQHLCSGLPNIFQSRFEGKKHIVFIDGIVLSMHGEIQETCRFWVDKDRDNIRLVFISLMSSAYKQSHADPPKNVLRFLISSWTLQEYLSAVRNQDFLNSVKESLDSCIISSEPLSTDDLIVSKYYFAGGSSRYMFVHSTERVINCLDEAVGNINIFDINLYLIGDTSNHVINRLFSSFKVQYGRQVCFSSEYVVTALAIKAGPQYISRMAQLLDPQNPSLNGWLMEIYFFASINKGGFNHIDSFSTKQQWPQCEVRCFDPVNVTTIPEYFQKIWLKPKKWNQGGYDAVYIEKESSLVRFVQVTRADKHIFSMNYFSTLLQKLTQQKIVDVKKLEIFFIIPEAKQSTFNLSVITGSWKELSKYGTNEWKKPEDSVQYIVVPTSDFPTK